MNHLITLFIALSLFSGSCGALEYSIWEDDDGVLDEDPIKFFSSVEQEPIRLWAKGQPTQIFATDDFYKLSGGSLVPMGFLEGAYGHLKLTRVKYSYQNHRIPRQIALEFLFMPLDFNSKDDRDLDGNAWEPMRLMFKRLKPPRKDRGASARRAKAS